MELKIYGRSGDVLGKPWTSEDAQSNRNLQPSSIFAKYIISSLTNKTTNELMNIAFRTVEISSYGDDIRRRFVENTGNTLKHRMREWYNFFSGKLVLIDAIKDRLKNQHSSFHFRSGTFDISSAIRNNMPSFRISAYNLSEMIAIGGVQEVEITGRVINEHFPSISHNYYRGNINSPHSVKVHLKIIMKDWFGVDEDDFTNFRPAALVDREGLAALWILQHQREFLPFINEFEHNLDFEVSLGSY